MAKYRIQIEDRKYSDWSVHNEQNEKIDIPICPIKSKLFTGDNFLYDNNDVKLLFSNIRNQTQYAGVLQLDKMISKTNKGKPQYKCIPDDTRLPIFLVSYQPTIGFSKNTINKYVLFQFDHWLYEHPCGKLINVLGNIDDLSVFYEYQLYCKNLHISMREFTNKANKLIDNKKKHDFFIRQIEENPDFQIQCRKVSHNVFSIDPKGSLDFDDAFSIQKIAPNKIQISIYIANVFVWLETLNIWDSFSNRVSTIYLPDRKRPMLPTILSDSLCSLQEGVTRFAFTMDVILLYDNDGNIIIEGEPIFSNTAINVYKNYVYEEADLLMDLDYLELFEITKQMKKGIDDSHDVVSYLMIFMNYHCGQNLMKYKNGIFRSTTSNVNTLEEKLDFPNNIPEDVCKFIKLWNSFSGQYIDYSKNIFTNHEILQMDAYTHITSPIRRLVDLLNMIQFQINNKIISFSNNANIFYEKWVNELEYINTTMRSIKKVQNDCNLLSLCSNNAKILNEEYEGYCFDKIIRNDGLFQYIVYIPQLKIASRIIIRENINNFKNCIFKLFVFNNEEKFKKKIRFQYIK